MIVQVFLVLDAMFPLLTSLFLVYTKTHILVETYLFYDGMNHDDG